MGRFKVIVPKHPELSARSRYSTNEPSSWIKVCSEREPSQAQEVLAHWFLGNNTICLGDYEEDF